MDFLTSTLISGLVYDIFKKGFIFTAAELKEHFSKNLIELQPQQAVEIYNQAQNIPKDDVQCLDRNAFISKYEKNFEGITNSLNQIVNSTNNGGVSNIAQQQTNHNYFSPPEKKTD